MKSVTKKNAVYRYDPISSSKQADIMEKIKSKDAVRAIDKFFVRRYNFDNVCRQCTCFQLRPRLTSDKQRPGTHCEKQNKVSVFENHVDKTNGGNPA